MSLLDDIDFTAIEIEIAEMIEDALDEVIDAGQEDLRLFGKALAFHMVTAIKTGDDSMIRSLKSQARMLAEINRIRLNREARALLSRILDVAARVGKAVLTAAIAAV